MAAVNPLKFLQEVRQEVGKVTWPTRQETLVSTIMVLIFVTLASIFFLAADQVIAWRALDGHYNSGRVNFERVDETTTKVTVQMEHETEGMVEALGSALGSDSRQVSADLERFKEFIEARGAETGGWRGEVEAGERVR